MVGFIEKPFKNFLLIILKGAKKILIQEQLYFYLFAILVCYQFFPGKIQAQTFTNLSGSSNYFNGVETASWGSAIDMVDIDDDGDLDAFITYFDSYILFYRNDGNLIAPSFTSVSGGDNPLNSVRIGTFPSLGFVDIDGDGDKDLFLGEDAAVIHFYRNTGSSSSPSFVNVSGSGNPFNGFPLNTFCTPSFADIDNDGDYDAFIGDASGIVNYYRNDGTGSSPVFVKITGTGNPLNGVSTGSYSTLSLGDCDADGDLDIITGRPDGTYYYFRNIGTVSSPSFSQLTGVSNPLNGFDVGTYSTPGLGDIDADGDADVFSGCNDKLIYSFINQTNQPAVNRTVGIGQAYSTIAAALAASQNGDFISIIAGTHSEHSINVNKSVKIIGEGYSNTIITGNNLGRVFTISAENVTIEKLTISDGNSSSGGGIYNSASASLTIENCKIYNNHAYNGAGIYTEANSTLTIDKSIISQNSITNASVSIAGGGLYSNGAATISNCTFQGNSITINGTAAPFAFGGGIYTSASSSSNISNCTFYENEVIGPSAVGGGLYLKGPATMTNCTVYNNELRGNLAAAGGINIEHPDITLLNCTIASNKALAATYHTHSGGVQINLAEGGGVIKNCIIANNRNSVYDWDLRAESATTLDYSLVEETLTPSGSNNIYSVDPMILSFGLNDNANGTYTCQIANTSPARDAGTSTGAPNTDQRGFARLNAVDMGAYESQAPYPPTVQSSSLSFSNITGTQIKLSWTNGNGENRIVLAKQGSVVNGVPVDGVIYTANATLGAGNQIGTGNYVVASTSTNSVTVTGLSSGNTYYFEIFEYNGSSNPSYKTPGLTGNATTTASPATVTTQAVTSITTTAAIGNGNITSLGSPNPVQHGVCWSTSVNPTIANSKTTEGGASSIGAFSSQISNLSPGTKYYVKAYVTNTAGTEYGSQVEFTTLALPEISTQSVSNIGGDRATGNATITVVGDSPTQHGICWNTEGTPTIEDNKTELGPASSTGTFTSNLTGLSPVTFYYVRAYATNAGNTVYGNQVTFTTLPFNGTGTVNSPFQIGTINNLQYLSETSSYWGQSYYFIQIANIDASSSSGWNSGEGIQPIGVLNAKFNGTYDGDGYAIDGLTINRPTDNYQGLFGCLDGAEIKNLGVTNVNVLGKEDVGALVGRNENNSIVTNSYSSGTVSGESQVGGLVGRNINSNVSCSYSLCTMTGTNWSLGGLVGYNDGATINNCYARGNVSGNNGVGGLVGNSSNTGSEVNNCYSTGTVAGTGDYIGGLIGLVFRTSVNNCLWDVTCSNTNLSAAGCGKSDGEMKTLSTFTGTETEGITEAWDFAYDPNDDSGTDDYWDIDPAGSINEGHPFLSWENGEAVALPVELTNFTASVEGNITQLYWQTATEINNYGFEVERQKINDQSVALNESEEWQQIGFIAGGGNSNSPLSYSFSDNKPETGYYAYRLKQIDIDGQYVYSNVIEVNFEFVPENFELMQNYPNPFNPTTVIRFQIPHASYVRLDVYDILGTKIISLVNGVKKAGEYSVEFSSNQTGQKLVSGVYFARIEAGNYLNIIKMLLVK